jgi:hypothetical protein
LGVAGGFGSGEFCPNADPESRLAKKRMGNNRTVFIGFMHTPSDRGNYIRREAFRW